jgi:hypothetical protein
VDRERSVVAPASGVALATAGTFLLVQSIGGLSQHQIGWIVAALGLAALVLCGLLLAVRGEATGDAKLAALIGALALPAGVAVASYSAPSPFGGGIPVAALLNPLAFIAGGETADAASDGLFAGALVLLLVYLWTRWPRLAFAAGVEAVLGLSDRLASGAGSDGSWIRGLVLLAIAIVLTVWIRGRLDGASDLAGSLAVPAGIAASIGAVLLPISDVGRLAVGSLAVAVPLLLWLLWLLVAAPRLGTGVMAVVGTVILTLDLGDGSHVWIAILVLAVGALLALAPLARPKALRT